MLQTILAATSASADLTAAQSERLGVYVLAAILGLLVTGFIALAKDIRREQKDR